MKLLTLRTTDSSEGWKLIIIKEKSVSLILPKPWRQKNFRNLLIFLFRYFIMIQQNKVINTSALSNTKLGADLNLFPKGGLPQQYQDMLQWKSLSWIDWRRENKIWYIYIYIFKLLFIICSMHFLFPLQLKKKADSKYLIWK